MVLKRLILLAAGAGAAWYAKQKLSEDGGAEAPAPPRQAQSLARAAAGVVPPPTAPAQPEPGEPRIETPALQEPPIEPVDLRPPWAGEPRPAAFEDAHQDGWQDEELGKDPAVLDELESDPATAADAELDIALEEAGEVPEPVADTEVARERTEPGHVTRVVDDLLEGRRDDAEDEPIEDATLVEEDPSQGSS